MKNQRPADLYTLRFGACLMKISIAIASLASLAVSGLAITLMQISGCANLLPAGMLVLMAISGWGMVAALLLHRTSVAERLRQIAKQHGMQTPVSGLEESLEQVLHDVHQKSILLAEIPLQREIKGIRALSQCLEQLSELIYETLEADSVEISLCNPQNGLFQNSFVKGIPLSSDIHDTLSKNLAIEETSSADNRALLTREISFAGQKLGVIRVAFGLGVLPAARERDLLSLLTTRCAIVLLGFGYSHELLALQRASSDTERTQTSFLATLSHEIRGPIGIILNAVELVLDGLCGEINQDQRETIGMIHGNGKHLLELINDVLDYAKVEAGMLTSQASEIGISDLLTDLIQVVRAQAEKKSHSLSVKPIEEALGMSCDRRHARQILINILTNAIKYSPENGVIELDARRCPDNMVEIRIKDSGIGIREEDFEKVFSPFQRIENGYAQKQGGTGLGMPLTKRLIELNDGTISFSSVIGSGTEFCVRFPFVSVSNVSEKINQSISRLTVQGRGEIVLIIAPAGEERLVLERYFKHAGFLALACSCADEICDILKGPRVHLGVIDSEILDSGHHDLIPILKEHSAFGQLPVAVVTSNAFPHDLEHYLLLGADRCFVKPISLREFGRGVRELLDRNSSLATAPTPQ